MNHVRRVVLAACLLAFGGCLTASAADFSSPNFSIDGNVGDSIAGAQSSPNYQMVGSGGDSINGSGSGGSYILGQGYGARLERSLQLNTQPQGLIGSYDFSETSGTRVGDNSANTNDLSAVGTPTHPTGYTGTGLSGFSSNDYATSVSDTAFNVTNLTSCAWLKQTATSTNAMAFTRSNGAFNTDGMWTLGFNNSSTLRGRIYLNGSSHVLLAPNDYSLNTWNMACISYDGSNFILYSNGSEVAREAVNGTMSSFSQVVTVGALSNGTTPFSGVVDNARIYSRALSADEIAAEYQAQSSGNETGLGLGKLTPGVSRTTSADCIVQTDASGYTLSINQNNNLTSAGNTISPVSGSIASPVTWSEGSTKGLGFTLYGTNATALPGTWSSGNAYAALPPSATTFYTRTGQPVGGSKDTVNMRLRLDAPANQATGNYTNQMTITGTMTP